VVWDTVPVGTLSVRWPSNHAFAETRAFELTLTNVESGEQLFDACLATLYMDVGFDHYRLVVTRLARDEHGHYQQLESGLLETVDSVWVVADLRPFTVEEETAKVEGKSDEPGH
jgi:hypothetical protein